MSRNNTGNPIDSKAFADFEDNVKNLDQAVNAEQDTFQDRLGKSRLTWAGIVRSGTGDPAIAVDAAARAEAAASSVEQDAEQIAQDAAQQAVSAVIAGVDGQVAVAQSAADRAEDFAGLAEDAVQYDYLVDIPGDLDGIGSAVAGERAYVRSNENVYRYSGTFWNSMGTSPGASKVSRADPVNGFISAPTAGSLAVDTANKTITLSGRVISGRRHINITTPVILSYSALSANHVVSVSLLTGEGRLTPVSGMGALPNDHAVLGVISPSTDEVYGVATYTIDGKEAGGGAEELAILGRQGTVYGANTNLRMDTTALTIRFVGLRLRAAGGVNVLIPDQTISYASHASPSIRYLVYNLDTQEVLIRTNTQSVAAENLVSFGAFNPVTTEFFGIPGGYQVDGFFRGGINTNGVSGTYYASPDSVKIDTDQNTLTTGGFGGRLISGMGVSHSFGAVNTVDIGEHTEPLLLVYSAQTLRARLVPRQNASAETTDSDVFFAQLDPVSYKITGLPGGYMIDGKVAGEQVVQERSVPALGWAVPDVFTSPILTGFTPDDPIPATTVDSAVINGWFDDLVAQYPEYVTRSFLGNEATGMPIYEYRFSPDVSDTPGAEVPKIMYQSGIHAEVMSYLVPHLVMKLICEEWENYEPLEMLRWGVEFSVIPALSPWGIANESRYNSNGVNLNRNYPAGWREGGDNPGPNPLSELETQYSYAVMQEFSPHIFIDMHGFGTATSGEHMGAFMWFPPSGSTESAWCGGAMINRMARKWNKENPWMLPASDLARSAPTSSPGGAARTAVESLNSIGAVYEVGNRLVGEPDMAYYSELTMRYATESVINYLMIVLRRNA